MVRKRRKVPRFKLLGIKREVPIQTDQKLNAHESVEALKEKIASTQLVNHQEFKMLDDFLKQMLSENRSGFELVQDIEVKSMNRERIEATFELAEILRKEVERYRSVKTRERIFVLETGLWGKDGILEKQNLISEPSINDAILQIWGSRNAWKQLMVFAKNIQEEYTARISENDLENEGDSILLFDFLDF
ncbi:hypothetical protein ACOME3_003806 [Neoechinorhynchus agilis]